MPEEPLSHSPPIPWDNLLRGIHQGHILPILGPGLSLIEENGKTTTIPAEVMGNLGFRELRHRSN